MEDHPYDNYVRDDQGGSSPPEGTEHRKRQARQRVMDQLQGTQAVEQPEQSAAPTAGGTKVSKRSSRGGAQVAFVYVRVSTREQARTGGGDEGYSIPAQRTACVEKARQLGAIVGGIYVDAGESAKSAQRPELQRMLRDVHAERPAYVIVHKIDRLARNRQDDIAINVVLKKAGSQLVSCSEEIADTPSGRFLYNIMADMAQFYSDNLAQEVLKGMTGMAQGGGTPTRAPSGYLHHRSYIDGVLASSVIVDPDRGPLVAWAFKQYATGEWTVESLKQALCDKGMTLRSGPKTPQRELTVTALNKMLRNPYYMGVVTFQGMTYEGKHEALVDAETWLRVQDVLEIRSHRGEKERKHPHYLRGSIYCGVCGDRLVYTQHTGRHGARYTYYGCIRRRSGARNCSSRVIRLEKIEDGIAELYRSVQLPVEEVTRLRRAVRGELAGQTADALEHGERANRQISQLANERAKLLRAHYEGAVPIDLLKTEMDRLTRAMATAEREASVAKAELADVEQTLEQALAVAASCWTQYTAAPPFIRRQINQGFFKKLWIGRDGHVERAEYTEPFEAVLGRTGSPEDGQNEVNRHPVTDDGSRGTHKTALVELRGFEPLTP